MPVPTSAIRPPGGEVRHPIVEPNAGGPGAKCSPGRSRPLGRTRERESPSQASTRTSDRPPAGAASSACTSRNGCVEGVNEGRDVVREDRRLEPGEPLHRAVDVGIGVRQPVSRRGLPAAHPPGELRARRARLAVQVLPGQHGGVARPRVIVREQQEDVGRVGCAAQATTASARSTSRSRRPTATDDGAPFPHGRPSTFALCATSAAVAGSKGHRRPA